MADKPKTIGWREVVDLPDLGIHGVPAKVDTGARTSVLHCSHIQLIKKGRKQYVEFRPLDDGHEPPTDLYTLPFHSERKIKNSFGQEENRYVINTTVSLFGERHHIEISLRDRSGMEFPMLLGRNFLRKRFIVDVSRSNLSSKAINKE